MRTPGRPTAIDLFAGAGGLSLGFEQAGFDLVAAVELDPIHCAAHEFNFPGTPILCADASRITGAQIRERARLGSDAVDVVCGGAPCQGFSMIGKRAFDDPRNRLVGHFLRIVAELNADYFLFENVKGLTVGKHRQFIEELFEEAERLGYSVIRRYQVLNAAEFGVPQDRRRLFLFGARRGLRTPIYPEKCTSPEKGTPDLVLPPTPTVDEAIGDIPDCELFRELIESDSVPARYGRPSRYAARLLGRADDHSDFSYPREFDRNILTASLRSEHTTLSRERFAATPPGKTEPVSRFHKLDGAGVCNTIRAGTASDRGAFTSPRPIHPHFARCITVREAARLHSYPDWFRFHVTKWHGFRQIGNSVPPLLARAVASKVREAIECIAARPADVYPLGSSRLLSLNMAEAAARYGVPHNTIPQRIRRTVEPARNAA